MKTIVSCIIIILMTFNSYSQTSNDSLRAHYKFNNTLWDSGENEFHGSRLDTLIYQDGIKCQAVEIKNNPYNAIQLDHNVLSGLSDFTISFFAKLNGLNNSNILISGATSFRDNEFLLLYNALGTYPVDGWQLRINNINHSFTSDLTMSDFKWHQVTITRKGNKASLYIDKVKIGNDISVDTKVLQIDANGLIIGQDQDCLGGCFQAGENWNGLLDELCIYDEAFDQSNIDDLYSTSTCSIVKHDTITVTDTLRIDIEYSNSILEKKHCQVKVFPNPTKDKLTINFAPEFNQFQNYSVHLISTNGANVFNSLVSSNNLEISLKNLGGNGLYFLQIKDDLNNIIDIKKIVLE